jgi:EAL and modified HD-GYP domain-containing signal transduction protein
MNVFVARQPIIDINGNLVAYELLYRNSDDNIFPDIHPDKATIRVLVSTFLSMGVDTVVGEHTSFVNFTGVLLAQNIFTNLDADRIVIEILENVEITPSLISRIRELREMGFKVALDDFILDKQYEVHRDLFELVDYIKVDFIDTDYAQRRKIEKFVMDFPNISLLAEKVETEAQYESAKKWGYTLFQGYFFAKPEIIKSTEIPMNIALHFEIIEKLNAETPNVAEIATLITHDMALTYRLLRLINTYAFGVPKKITSIKQAIVIIGVEGTKKWMYILTLYEMGEGTGKGRTKALVDNSLTRAKLLELVAIHKGKKNADEHFLAGMFSLINIIMKRDWEDILPKISLSDKVSKTLRGEQTEMTEFIQLAESLEYLDIQKSQLLAGEMGITMKELSKFSKDANQWAQQIN